MTKRKLWLKDREAIREKAREALSSVLPLIAVVILLCATVSPVRTDLMLNFVTATLLIVLGMGLFSLGADQAMTPIGSKVGTAMTKSKNLPFILIVSFFVGFAVTVAEPDLQVLAQTVPHINGTVLLLVVGAGVGLFLSICMLRVLMGWKLRWLLLGFYGLIFLLAAFTDRSFLAVAFDSGGVTTGPMTVPFILALGVGVSKIRSDRAAEADSFGLVALASAGPILAVLILGFFYKNGDAAAAALPQTAQYGQTTDILKAYLTAFPSYLKEMLAAMLPILIIFIVFQIFSMKLPLRELLKIVVGLLYTYVGLVLFLTGVNVGFSSLGAMMGAGLATGPMRYLLIPLAMILGWFIISAEPAVAVLEKQIEEVSAGAIPGKAIKYSMSIGVSIAMGIAMLRVLTGVSILWFLVPGYAGALLLSFFVPDIYTAIAFDSGGVASGPLTATFMLQFVIGAATALGRNVLTDAFGLVAMVAMMPLLSIQVVGLIYEGKRRKEQTPQVIETFGDCDIVELWEEAA